MSSSSTSPRPASTRLPAATLFLSPGTVRDHLSSAMHKLGVSTRAEAVRLAQERGWL